MNERLADVNPAPPLDWQTLLQQHGRWLRTVLVARSGEPQAADELMQEVALAAVAQRAPLRDPAKVAPWLYQLAVRQALMYRRKQGRRRKLELGYAEKKGPEPSPVDHDPLGWLLARERQSLIRKAIEQLKPRDAEILLLKYTEDWSYQEIAAHLGLSHSAVESRLHRARHRLRQELQTLQVVEAPV